MRPATSLAMALGLLVAPVATGHARAAAGPTQTDATGPVTVAVTPLLHTAGEPLALRVALDTHSVNLDGIAFDRAVAVRTAAGPVAPLRIESAKGSGHHREAIVVFAPSALPRGAGVLEVVVKDVGGVAERLFRWDVPFEAAQAKTPASTPAAGAGPSGAGVMGPGGGGMMGGSMMSGGQAAPGTGAARPGGSPDMSKMMERMAEMQTQMAEMHRRTADVTGAPR